jgi:drug/metabolite transporter (DMT)-like permease
MDSKFQGYLFVSISGILSGFIIFGGAVFSSLGLSLFEISIFPYVLATIIVAPFAFYKGLSFPKNKLGLLLFYGFVTAGAILTQFAGVVFGASVAVVVLLLYSQPVWTILISRFFLKEKVLFPQLVACVLVLIGVFFLVDPANLFSSSSWWGVLFALLGGIFLSLWVVVSREIGKVNAPTSSIFFLKQVLGLVLTFLFYPVMLFLSSVPSVVSFSLNQPLTTWLLLIVYAFFITVVNHFLYLIGSKHISATNAGIILLLEPVVGIILSVVFLSQPLTLPIVAGGALILLGNYLVIVKG